jgi:hypothetical protein
VSNREVDGRSRQHYVLRTLWVSISEYTTASVSQFQRLLYRNCRYPSFHLHDRVVPSRCTPLLKVYILTGKPIRSIALRNRLSEDKKIMSAPPR